MKHRHRSLGSALPVYLSRTAIVLLLAMAVAAFARDSDTADFFVSPSGNDNWSGKRAKPDAGDGPFATLRRARDAVRVLLTTRTERQPVRVVLRGGTYYLNAPVEFGPEDSGTEIAPVIYAAAPNEQV